MLTKQNVIDLVTRDPQGGDFELAIVAEAGEWADPKALWYLQEKVNGCLAFGLDGEMHRRYPDSVGKPLSIAVVSVDDYPEAVRAFIERIRPAVEAEGIGLVVKNTTLDRAA